MIEAWMDYITGVDNTKTYEDPYVSHRMAYPQTYKNNIYLTKFEKDHFMRDYSANKIGRVNRGRGGSSRTARTTLDYTFVQAFPLSLTAIPVSYEESSVLKCTVSFNFIRYVQKRKQSHFTSLDLAAGVTDRSTTKDLIVNKVPQRIDTWRDLEDEPSGFVDELGNERF
tara:strand:- start:24 stop:530 length:507 start_codon:yes stop_codon:yes gene_type:complete